MENNEQKNKEVSKLSTRELFSETLLVAGLTATGYLAACAYQLSYITTFGISSLFLSVDSSLVFFTVLTLLFWISLLITVFSLLISWKISNWIRIPSVIVAGLVLIFLPSVLLLFDPKYPTSSIFSVLTFIMATSFMVKGAYKHVKNNTEPQDGVTKLLNSADMIFGTPRVLITVIACIFILLGAGFGRVSAKIQKNFLISSADPDVAIVTVYKDSFVGLVFDPATGVIGKETKIINQNNLSTSTTFVIKELKNSF